MLSCSEMPGSLYPGRSKSRRAEQPRRRCWTQYQTAKRDWVKRLEEGSIAAKQRMAGDKGAEGHWAKGGYKEIMVVSPARKVVGKQAALDAPRSGGLGLRGQRGQRG